jgi:hypothetical protein
MAPLQAQTSRLAVLKLKNPARRELALAPSRSAASPGFHSQFIGIRMTPLQAFIRNSSEFGWHLFSSTSSAVEQICFGMFRRS